MVADSRQELFESQTAEQYEQIGRFVVEFEQVCFWLRLGITAVLYRDGLKTQSLALALIDNSFMTAGPLIETFDSIATEIGAREDPIQKEVLDQVSKEFRALVSERNKIVHGLWFIGYASADDQDFSTMAGIKGRPSKTEGMGFQLLPTSAAEIAELVERALNLRHLLMNIHAILHGMSEFKNNFIKVGNTWTLREGVVS